MSAETVRSHVQNALSKLGAHTRAHAVAIALVTGQIIDGGRHVEAGGAVTERPRS